MIKFPIPENTIERCYCDEIESRGDIIILWANRNNVCNLYISTEDEFRVLHCYTIDKSTIDLKDESKLDLKKYVFNNLEEAIKVYNKITGENIPLSCI